MKHESKEVFFYRQSPKTHSFRCANVLLTMSTIPFCLCVLYSNIDNKKQNETKVPSVFLRQRFGFAKVLQTVGDVESTSARSSSCMNATYFDLQKNEHVIARVKIQVFRNLSSSRTDVIADLRYSLANRYEICKSNVLKTNKIKIFSQDKCTRGFQSSARNWPDLSIGQRRLPGNNAQPYQRNAKKTQSQKKTQIRRLCCVSFDFICVT